MKIIERIKIKCYIICYKMGERNENKNEKDRWLIWGNNKEGSDGKDENEERRKYKN